MVDLPKKKVGIVACSGEKRSEGTVTRLAALKVLEQLRPGDTVTICLPLFLAGGEGDRAFAKFYPTIAVDGCELRCAARGTERYSGKPAASIIVSKVVAENGLEQPSGKRRLDEAGKRAVEATAQKIADTVDDLLGKHWNRSSGDFSLPVINSTSLSEEPASATCSCGSGIPIQTIVIDGKSVTLLALPAIFRQFEEAGKVPNETTGCELLETVKIYNPIAACDVEAYTHALLHEYELYLERKRSK